MATKTYVLDTSVLIHDPHSIKTFEDCQVVIPLTVLGELDNLKAGTSQAAHAAREASRIIDTIRDAGHKLTEFAPLAGTTVRICVMNYSKGVELPTEIDLNVKDNQIIATAITARDLFNRLNPEEPQEVVLVSKDTVLRLVAESVGMKAEDYKKDKVSSSYVFGDVSVPIHIIEEEHAELLEKGVLVNRRFEDVKDHALVRLEGTLPKGAVVVKQSHGKRGEKTHQLKLLTKKDLAPYDLKPRNAEQLYALYLLMEPSIRVVTISGLAGSGKSILTLAAGLEQVQQTGKYKRMVVIRPTVSIGEELGYLPGPQPLDAKVLSPTGWTTMGALKSGDRIMTASGKTTRVLQTYPKGVKDVYRVSTTDGTSTECCEDHLWVTKTWEEKKRNKPGSVRSLSEIIRTVRNAKDKLNHYLPRNGPIEYSEKTLPISPYVLGVLLGDGHISNSISFASIDQEIVNRVRKELNSIACTVTRMNQSISYNIRRQDNFYTKGARAVIIEDAQTGSKQVYSRIGIAIKETGISRNVLHDRCRNSRTINGKRYSFDSRSKKYVNPVKEILEKLGLLHKRAWEKKIPDLYKNGSVLQRLSLLQGLMDTDGSVKKRTGEASFTTTSYQMAKDVEEIVRSLGGRCCVREPRNRTHEVCGNINGRPIQSKRLSYEFTISLPKGMNPFYLDRKAAHHKCRYIYDARINSIEYIGKKQVQCILVEDPSHLYITDDFIVTHNTLDDKMAPWMKPIYDNVETLLGGEDPTAEGKDGSPPESKAEHLFASKVIEVAALSFLRGRTISNALIYIDEAQNISPRNLKSCITRAGSHSKVVIAGDIDQIDTSSLDKYSCGLAYVAERFRHESIAGHAILTRSERSTIAEIAAKLL